MVIQGTLNSQSNFGKESKVGGFALPDFKNYRQPTVIKTVWHWHKDKDQQNRTDCRNKPIYQISTDF